MSPQPKGISLNKIYSRQGSRLLGEYKQAHQQAVAKILNTNEIVLYAWWEETALNPLYLYLYLATQTRIIWFMPKQFDKKAVVLEHFTFDYKRCKRAFLKKKEGTLFSRSRYIIHVDHDLNYGMGGLDLTDKFYTQEEIEKIASDLTELIDKFFGAGPNETTQSDDLLAQLERLGKLKQEGLLTDEEFAAAKKKLLDG